jgi:predicted nucleic acid-binding Zn ribbon protein
MSEDSPDTGAMRAAFWIWMGIIAAGLAVMIVLPLAGR